MAGCSRKLPAGPVPVESLHHDDKRVNIPTADASEMVDTEAVKPAQLRYPRDLSLDPQLVWRGKDEQDSDDLVVDAPPIYIQEKIDPRVLIENLRRTAEKPEDEPELSLFDSFDGLDGWDAVEFYKHTANWSNRMVLGDSLQVMGSLAEKENLRGQVQMIYIDPPYGVKFNSNWQASTQSRDVSDGQLKHATREVEQIKAFRDTWANGRHTYLAYIRDRLTVARDLLTESGSIFLQIGDENVHLVRSILDEVFGADNFVSIITYTKTAGQTGEFLPGTSDFILWYCKSIEHAKFRRLYQQRLIGGPGSDKYSLVELADGTRITAAEATRRGATGRALRLDNLTSQSVGREKGEGAASWFTVELDGRRFTPTQQSRWKTNEPGMKRLLAANRVQATRNTLSYVRYHDDFPAYPLSNTWTDIGGVQSRADPKIYVVQTATTTVQRCMLMTTDPGDLVLDPTCGSGTTAVVAEQWGRRWITIDTSRVALALARQRVMGIRLPAYVLADSAGGRVMEEKLTGLPQPAGPANRDVRQGFVYERVPHVTLKSIANNPDIKEGISQKEIDAAIARHAETELLYDRPYEDKKKVRVAGPFTVESLSPHRAVSLDAERPASERAADADVDAAPFEQMILDNLLKAGVQNGIKNERLEFESLVPFAGRLIQAEGVRKNGTAGTPQRIAVSIGPQYGTVSQEWMRDAVHEALRGEGFDLLLVLAFAFDPQALAKVQDFRRIRVLPVRMNADLAMGESLLKKTSSGNLFTVFGEPDVHIRKTPDGQLTVEIFGVDVYNPTTGEIRSNDTKEIALWMIDTQYDGESFFVRHCYFTGGNDPYIRLKRALKADIDEAAWSSLYSTRSRSFAQPETGRIAVKVINHYGDEVLKVYDV